MSISMPTPTEIEVLNYHFNAKSASAVLVKMLNQPGADYSTADELTAIESLSAYSADEILEGICELHSRGFLLSVKKRFGTVYAVNKLRLSNMMFVYG